MTISHDDLCALSRCWNASRAQPHGADYRVNQWLKQQIAIAEKVNVKAEAKSQEPDAVAWPNGCDETVPQALRFLAENDRRLGGSDAFNSEHLYQLAGEIEKMASKPLYTHPTTKPEAPAVSVDAILKVRSWLATERCSDPLEVIDDALIAAGIKEVPCPECNGAGEWDEGPLPATSSTQISPDYRQVKCPECKGSGRANLIVGER